MAVDKNEVLKKQLEITGVNEYHKKGFKGKGITILNHEAGTEHGGATTAILKKIAPEATIIEASVTSVIKSGRLESFNWKIDGVTYTFEEVMRKFKPDIMSVSLRGEHSSIKEQVIKPYIDNGDLIVCNSAGNNAEEGVQGYYKTIALNIGSVQLFNGTDEIRLVPYSGRTKGKREVSFTCFEEFLGGTSAACPYFAGMLALFMSRYNIKPSQSDMVEIIKPFCTKLGSEDEVWKFGNGLFILPDKEKIELVEENNFVSYFKDVDAYRWSADNINWAVANGIVTGYIDETFKPEKNITREECVTMCRRLYNLIIKEINNSKP